MTAVTPVLRDRRGVEIKVGDVAVHATSGRYGSYDVVRIAELRPTRVRVDAIDYFGLRGVSEPASAVWLTPSTLVVATLPPKENRLS